MTVTSPLLDSCVESDREDDPFFVNLYFFIWFQGSEWNAANIEELQKNKSVSLPAAVSIALCTSVVVVFPIAS